MMSYVLDTSFLSALIISNDLHHEEAHTLLASISGSEEFFIPASVVFELECLPLAYNNHDLYHSVDALLQLFSWELIEFDHDFLSFWKESFRSLGIRNKPLDSSILVCCLYKRASLLSFDKRLIAQADVLSSS